MLCKVFLKGIVITVSVQQKFCFDMELQTCGLDPHTCFDKAMRKPLGKKYMITHASKILSEIR
jgi:hypothetical protein